VAASLCDQIAKLRRRLQRIPTAQLLFLDETAVRISEAPPSTLVLPGEQPYVVVDDTSSYAARYDMIACCNGERVFPPKIFTPQERGAGINAAMLLAYIRDLLAQSVGALDCYPLYLVIDRSAIHQPQQMLQEFHDWGCQELKEIIFMPAQAAKRLSPLDNALFHDWKEAIRKRCPLTKRNISQIMADEWNNLHPSKIAAHYRHCGYSRATDSYFDCPDPSSHQHDS
jgi:hypothetical protein